MNARLLGWIAALVLFAAPACAAAESGRVVRVIDGDSLEVDVAGAKLEVRLLGVDTPELGDGRETVEFFAAEARRFTSERALGTSVHLERDPEGDTRDRYGRALRYVHLPDGRLLNAEIIAQGYGHAYTRFPFSRLAEFRGLEREARSAGRGLWRADRRTTIGASEAAAHTGEVAEVCGTVASARFARSSVGQPTFLNLDRPHPDQVVTIVIWGNDREAFDEPERRYAGRRICITGKVDTFGGKPQIEARDPSQIEVEDGPAPGRP